MFNFDTVGTSNQTPITTYRGLPDKPHINGIELVGDKSLDSLGIQEAGDYAYNSEVNEKLDTKEDKFELVIPLVRGADNKIRINYDNKLLQINASGELTVNLDEIGSELTEKLNVDMTNLSQTGKDMIMGMVSSSPTEKYGIQGDYATRYGILECPNGILKNTSGKEIVLQQGVVLQCAGQESKTMITGDLKHTITSEGEVDIFYAGGELLECGEVFYQTTEPDNGVSNYIAWWNPEVGKWQFKSNSTGNVFREIVACRIAHIHVNAENITRIDYIGNRILDDEIFAMQEDLTELEMEVATKADVNQLPASTSLLKGSALYPTTNLATDANLSTTIQKVNEIIAILVNRGIARIQG